MRGRTVYGLVFIVVVVGCLNFPRQPEGEVVLYGLLSLQVGWWAAGAWRRAGLAYLAAAFGLAAVGLALLGVLALRGYLVPFLSVGWWAVLGLVAVGIALCRRAEKRRHPEAYALVREHEREGSFWDILLGRFPLVRESAGQ